MTICYVTVYYGYGDEPWFNIEKVFYGNNAKELAIELAIKLNIKDMEEVLSDCDDRDTSFSEVLELLKNNDITPEKRLKKYIKSLDYSYGNYKYDTPFYGYTCCDIEFTEKEQDKYYQKI